MINLDIIAKKIGELLIFEAAKEIQMQGHAASGKLIQSLEFQVANLLGGRAINVSSEDYGKFVDTGRRRGAKQPPIQVLIDWVKTKGITSSNKLARQIAWAIAKTIVKEGIPTSGSFRFTKNGRRKDWVDFTLKNSDIKMLQILESEGAKEFEREAENLAKKMAVALNGQLV